MGHQRLGTIPTSLKWTAVIATLQEASKGNQELSLKLAADVLEAAAPALALANKDAGLRYTFYLLTQVVLAARQPDWAERLATHGIEVTETSSVFDLTSQLQYALDDHIREFGRPTDISEMAQRAAGEALAGLANDRTIRLFDSGGSDIKTALQAMSTENGFSALGQKFFGRFMSRFLNFYLSRATATNIGAPALGSVGEVSAFNDALRTHCDQSARIVRDFCGQWYSKTEYQQGINQDNSSRFMAIAVRKLSNELVRQRARL